MADDKKEFLKKVKDYQKDLDKTRKEIGKVVVGQERIVNGFLKALLCNGHVLVEGIPGIAKTLIVRSLAKVCGCDFSRIQFTADLLPTDIVGITTYEKEKGFYIVKGPIFSNFILGDEINRAPPKVQSALLECMQERQVTIGKETFQMEEPFIVMATQNPIESLGTYPLPEAQIDRFLFKLLIRYPTVHQEQRILTQNMTLKHLDDYDLQVVLSQRKLIELSKDVHKIYLDKKIEEYIVHIVDATRYPDKYNLKQGKFIEWGSSPRGAISMYIAAKADALMHGKVFTTPQHVKEVAHDVLRHRILLNYEGQAEGTTSDDVISEILAKIPVP
jgi:MoxR-like ATPase